MKFKFLLFIALVSPRATTTADDVYPFSDPSNEGNWVLNEDVSDEFEQSSLDTDKWLIQGAGGEYKSRWIGRAPSQFSPDNVRIEDGKLKIQTRWEPDFEFSDKIDRTNAKAKNGQAYENITTAAVIAKRQFSYGYMETKCKAADASITSSFWMTGKKSELDVFEFIGAPKLKHKQKIEKRFQSNLIDWGKPKGSDRRVWRGIKMLDWRVADDFHVYGCDWSEQGLKFFADGELLQSVSAKELGEKWVLTEPFWVWFDSETFPWDGIPEKADLPVDFEIEYVRIWHKQ